MCPDRPFIIYFLASVPRHKSCIAPAVQPTGTEYPRLMYLGKQRSSAEYGSHTARPVFGPTEAPTDEAVEWRSTRSSRRR